MLIDAYERVMASPRLAGVKVKALADESALERPGSNPRMIWLPTVDAIAPPDSLMQELAFVDGKRVIATSHFLRAAGCNIHLFVDYGPRGQAEMEDLIRQVANAFYEELKAPGPNFVLGSIQWLNRGAIADKPIECIWSITVGVPLWDTDPAQLLTAVDTAGSRFTGPTE